MTTVSVLRGCVVRGAMGIGLAGVMATASAQTERLYITDGDEEQMAIVQGGVLIEIVPTHKKGYPIAVNDSVWIGDYSGHQPYSIEYDVDGKPTGNFGEYDSVLAVDGASDGTRNFQLGGAFGAYAKVYSADEDWQNERYMFRASGSDMVGITYDSVNQSIWVSDKNEFYEYNLDGKRISRFEHSSGRGCIAYETTTDTIWFITNSSERITQYSKTGEVLQVLSITGLIGNNWGAEFAPNSVEDECLQLTVSELEAGDPAFLDVEGAVPFSTVVVVWGPKMGETILNGQNGFCSTFGIAGVDQQNMIGLARADDRGHVSFVKKRVPEEFEDRTVFSQASQRDTCPEECMSNIDEQIVD